MSKPSEKLIHKLAEEFCPGWETITSARSALVASFNKPGDLLCAIEKAMDEPVTINDRPKPAIPVAFVSNHIDNGGPRSYAKYQLCRTKCGQHFIGIRRGDTWLMKTSLDNKADTPIPEGVEVEYWVDLD